MFKRDWPVLAAIIVVLAFSCNETEARDLPRDYDRNLDGKLDRYEQYNYERNTGKKANDLRGGLNLEPEILRPYDRLVIDNGEDKIEY